MPKVSVVIPTLNRANLLRWALKSAVEQDFQDFEIIVSDDCSIDDTRRVVDSFGSPKVIYVAPPKRLNMPDSFEFALKQARGEYLTFLTDDSYLMPDCISVALRNMDRFGVDLAVWRHCSYFGADWIEPSRRNVLYLPQLTFRSDLRDSRQSLRRWFTSIRAHSAEMPRSINSLCHRSIIEKALAVQGRFFQAPAPDHSSGAAMLLNTERYVLIDQALVIDGVSPASIGPSQSFNFGESAQEFYRSFKMEMDEVTFLGIPTTPAIIAKSFENTRRYYPGCPELNMKNVLENIVDSLVKLEVYGSDMSSYWQTLKTFANTSPNRLSSVVLKQRIDSWVKWRLVKAVRLTPAFAWIEGLRGLKTIKGAREGFENIELAAMYLAEWDRSRRSTIT